MKFIKTLPTIALLVVSALVFFSSCGEDEPVKTRVYGTITIDNNNLWATWKDSGEVQVTVFPKFSLDPLAGWGAVPTGTFGPNVPGGTFAVGAPYNSQNPLVLTYVPGKNAYEYEVELEPGTYSALALGFRHNRVTDPSLKTATLGVHWNTPGTVSHGVVIAPFFNYPAPVSFDIAAGEEKEINFKADFGFVINWYR